MSNFTELQLATSEQHVEMRVSRIKRDFEDINKMITWLQNHNPFDDIDPSLRSLSSGQASNEKDGINCDIAEDVGIIMQKKMDNKSYTEISFKGTDQVRALENIRKGTRIADDTIHIDPMLLFSRLLIQVERSENIQFLFAYELASTPTSLYKNNMMRKGKKVFFGLLFERWRDTCRDIRDERCQTCYRWGRTVTSCLLEIRFLIHGCCISVCGVHRK